MIRLTVSSQYQAWATRCFTLWVTGSGGGSGLVQRCFRGWFTHWLTRLAHAMATWPTAFWLMVQRASR
jgi:hypothetical protein